MKTPNAKDIQAAYEHGKFLRRQECTGEGRMLADLSHEVQMLRETCAACEGCGNPRTTSDSDGVPLCDACAKACDQDAKNEKEATP